MATVDVDRVSIAFGANRVLDDVSLTIASGELVALLGPSGSGKSTLLRVIAGTVTPDAGRVMIDGVDVTTTPTHRRHVGMVFQDNQLFPHRSVLDNVAFGLQMAGVARHDRHAKAEIWLERVGLAGLGGRDVAALSGGEAKRVALARTLIVEPLVVLLDEPLTGLDRDLHDRLALDLADLLRATGTTALLVTHDEAEAAAIADRTLTLPDIRKMEQMSRPARDLLHFSGEGGTGRIVEVAAADTHDLRRRVLRDDSPTATLEFDGDDEPTTFHLAVERDDVIVAVSTWMQRPLPEDPRDTDIQLRGMASEPALQGRGLGAALLRAGLDRAHQRGTTRVWARARSTALGFYVANGFDVAGEEFVDGTTGLPHRIVVVDVPVSPSHRPR
ncbi:MAG: GNAT family N-acetyltransferase [Ilumatobacteraceae bacterium]